MSTSETFLARLRAGLRGLPPPTVDDILGDYAAHFREAAAAGRTPEDVAARLGDPDRLARELRAQAGLRRWEEQRSPGAAIGAIVAVLGLATIDLFILLPLLIGLGGVLLGAMVTGLAVSVGGALLLLLALVHAVPGFGGTWLQGVLLGIGVTSGGVALVTGCTLVIILTLNLLVRYGRLHLRAVAPHPMQPSGALS